MAHGLKRLDLEKTEIKTSYCVSNDVREDQMRVAVSRIPGRVAPADDVSEETIAIACFGPSLKYTWQEIAKFPKVMTCSGAHKFLLEKGIVPTWHVDLDPREHKVRMLGTPHKDVEYLIASCCHPKMWDVLEGCKVKLWHIFNNEDNRELPLAYPRGDWILTGGNNVGLRCMVVARMMGYRKFHVFGMDCSFPKDGGHHADTHLNANPKLYEVPFGGKTYYCEPVMLTYAKQFFHEMNQLPDVQVVLHGEGLLQHMAYARRNDKIQTKKHAAIAFATPVTITKEHVEKYRKLHLDPVYGLGGRRHRDVVARLAAAMKTTNILDYGCGKGALGAGLKFPIWEYDPAIAGKDNVPRPADLVVCTDVLQHVEPDMLANVCGDLVRCARLGVFAVISMEDGEIKGDRDWWHTGLNKFFKIATMVPAGNELHCVLEPRKMGPLA